MITFANAETGLLLSYIITLNITVIFFYNHIMRTFSENSVPINRPTLIIENH